MTGPAVTRVHPDRMLAAMARRQHGVVSREQLALLGFTERMVQQRLASGHLHSVHRGVYAVGHLSLTWRGRVSGAVLACGLDAVASHTTAGVIHEFLDTARALEVTDTRRHRIPGVTTHRSALHQSDRWISDGIPVSSALRTLLDLAAILPAKQFERAFEEADRIKLVEERQGRELLARSSGHRGVGRLAAMLDETFAHAPTKRELERLFFELVRDAGLPLPLVNVWVEGRQVDAYWPARRLVVELDSKTYHRTDAKLERDYATSAELKLAGYEILRFTWKQVTRQPELVLALLRAVLA